MMNARKRDDMKRLALVSVAALMLTATFFAPGAQAQSLGDPVESVTLGPEGSVIVTGTVQCPEGGAVGLFVEVRQRKGHHPYNVSNFGFFTPCEFLESLSY
jgi:hypothetical protein